MNRRQAYVARANTCTSLPAVFTCVYTPHLPHPHPHPKFPVTSRILIPCLAVRSIIGTGVCLAESYSDTQSELREENLSWEMNLCTTIKARLETKEQKVRGGVRVTSLNVGEESVDRHGVGFVEGRDGEGRGAGGGGGRGQEKGNTFHCCLKIKTPCNY